MKKNVLLEIFHGNAANMEIMFDKHNINNELAKLRCDVYDELAKTLNPSQLILLNKLCDLNCDTTLEEVEHIFVESFKLGIKVGKQVFCEDDEQH